MTNKKLKEIRAAIKNLPSGKWEWEKKKGVVHPTKLICKKGGTTHILLFESTGICVGKDLKALLENCRDYIADLLKEVKRLTTETQRTQSRQKRGLVKEKKVK